jgi:hypothetical protein
VLCSFSILPFLVSAAGKQKSPEALLAFPAALLTDFVVLDASLLIQKQGQFMFLTLGHPCHEITVSSAR